MDLIKEGSAKSRVQEVQRALKGLGLYTDPLDGLYGPKTAAAVRMFQRLHRLNVDGIVGPKTYSELLSPSSTTELRDRPNIINNPQPNEAHQSWPFQKDVESYYGNVEEIPKKLVRITPPYKLWYAGNMNLEIKSFQIHEKVAPSVDRVLKRVLSEYGEQRIKDLNLDVFGGSYVKRQMRGSNRWSMHAYGIAIDWDPVNNQLRWDHTKAKFAGSDYRVWFSLWREEGWVGLGPSKDFDWMHVQAARV